MKDQDNLQSRLAREEATLSATHDQISAGHRKIETLQEQIEATKREIKAGEEQIAKLQEHTKTIEKRMALLREYIAMVESGDDALEAVALEEPEAAPSVVATAPAAPNPPEGSKHSKSEAAPAVEEVVEGVVDLEFVQPLSGQPDPTPASTSGPAGPISLESIDEDFLSHEILPRTQTFGEELLLVMGFHKKTVAPKSVAKLFRHLDYAPKVSPTTKNVKDQVESENHLYEVTGDKLALTREGRDEAQRLLEQLS